MKLNQEEKSLIDLIVGEEICDQIDFVNKRLPLKRVTNNTANFMGSGTRTINAGEVVLVTENSAQDRSSVGRFIALCKRLEKSGLIQLVDRPATGRNAITVFSGKKDSNEPIERRLQVDSALTALCRDGCSHSIVPFEELSDFVSRGYLTQDEYALHEEREARRRAERTTLFIAVFTVCSSVVTSIGIAWFNYKTYTKERVVTISNAAEFAAPKEVRVIEMPAVKPIETKQAASNNSLQGRRP